MKLTIRMNAEQDTVTIDGHTFDRSGLDRGQRHAMAALVRDTLVKDGTVQDRSPKTRTKARRSRPRRRSR